MRKLKLQMQLSLDGFVAGPNGEMDWMTWNWDDEIKDYVNKLHEPVDTILLGRKMTDGFISHWKNIVSGDPKDEQYPFAKIMYDTAKVVFSKTITESMWDNTVVANGDIIEEVNKLKNKPGGDIITYGGAGFASSLIKHNLVDEYHIFLNPAAIGNGMGIFNKLEQKLAVQLVKAIPFPCGITTLVYKPA